METWAHGQEIFDQLGFERIDTDRIKNIVVIGVNTFGWTFINRNLAVPEKMPKLSLLSPSNKLWEWNEMKHYNFWDEEHNGCDVVAGQNIADHCIAPKYENGFWLDTSIEGSTFYITTGTHGAHVFIGLIALGYLIAKANKDGYNEEYN